MISLFWIIKKRPSHTLASLSVWQQSLGPDTEVIHLLEQWLEIGLVVCIVWGDDESERHFWVSAAGNLHPVSEDVTPLALPHDRFKVAPPGLVVLALLAVGLCVVAIYIDDTSHYRLRVEKRIQ